MGNFGHNVSPSLTIYLFEENILNCEQLIRNFLGFHFKLNTS